MKQQNTEQLEQRVWAVSDPESPEYGQYWTLEELASVVSPPTEHLSRVMDWIHQHGIFSYEISATRDSIVVHTDVATAEALLSTAYHVYRRGDAQVLRTPRYAVPEEIAEVVELIGGTVRLPGPGRVDAPEPRATGMPDPPLPGATTPKVIRARYNVDAAGEEPRNLQAVASFLEQYIDPEDLRQFQADHGCPVQPVERWIGPNDPTQPGGEASLDIEYIMGVAPGVRTWVWNTAGRQEGQEPFLRWLHDVSTNATVPMLFSISYQDLEDTLSRSYMARVSREFQKAAVRGITLLTGSGDWGTQCTKTCDRFRPDFPSSSPFITSLGATQYTWDASFSSIIDETATSWSSGGFSDVFAMPRYQQGVVHEFLNKTKTPTSYFNPRGRAFPDLSTIGLRFDVITGGLYSEVGGTSASTPTFGAMVSLLNDQRLRRGLKPMGFVNPFLYWARAQSTEAFNSVNRGNNRWGCCTVGFDCVEGWDAITGLGTPDFRVLSRLALRVGL
eukprot:gnl/Trimastix_PCT/959.p2 GENE.gnl/Trimastix_PCT/959~~gnl/Trimastix_PCT/959.p2  ORF type:complete len:569 (-),score=176.49 gnl/Trimastix_PCT/959:702-2207(-)